MATVTNQATLRIAIKDWLNRTDLTSTQVDQFIEMGEAKVYEELRVPELEKSVTITVSNSRISIPDDFLELIEIRKTGVGSCSIAGHNNPEACVAATGEWTSISEDDNIILTRTDTRNLYASDKHSITNSFARDGSQWVITDSSGRVNATGLYIVKYYKVDNSIGSVYTVDQMFRSTSTECSTLEGTFSAYTPDDGFGACTVILGVCSVAGENGPEIVANILDEDACLALGNTSSAWYGGDIEKDSWLLNDYEIILFAACSIASEFLGNDEDVARYTRLYLDKLRATNMKAANAQLKGANVSMRFQNFQGL